MHERIVRRVKQTNSLNKDQILKEVRIWHKDERLSKKIANDRLESSNKVFFENVNKVTGYYDIGNWTEEYKANRKIEESKLKKLKKENDRDFAKSSKAYKTLDEIFSMKNTFYKAKLDKEVAQARYFIKNPNPHFQDGNYGRSKSANLKARTTYMTVLETERDFDPFQVYDPFYLREVKETLKRRKNGQVIDSLSKEVLPVTLEGLESQKLERMENIKSWQVRVPKKREFMLQMKIEEARANSQNCCDRKELIRGQSMRKESTAQKKLDSKEKTQTKGFFIKRPKTSIPMHH